MCVTKHLDFAVKFVASTTVNFMSVASWSNVW